MTHEETLKSIEQKIKVFSGFMLVKSRLVRLQKSIIRVNFLKLNALEKMEFQLDQQTFSKVAHHKGYHTVRKFAIFLGL